KCLEPTPKEPIHFRHDEKRNEYWSDQQKHCLGYQTESDDHQDNSLDCGQYHVQHDERERLVKAERTRLLHSLLDFGDLRLDQPPLLHAYTVGERRSLLHHQIRETLADPWNWRAVILDHRKAKGDD